MKYKKTISSALLLLTSLFLYDQNNRLTVSRITHTKNVPPSLDGYRILQLSDIQNKVFGKRGKRLIKAVKAVSPHVILITGDLIDRRKPNITTAMTLIRELVSIAPVYFVSGNHEQRSGVWVDLENALSAVGVKILDNGSSVAVEKGYSLSFIGLADRSANPCYEKALSLLTGGNAKDSFQILLSHRPELFDDYVKSGVDLVFTGHAHGGQIRLPVIGPVFAPHQGFFPKYTSGAYTSEKTTMVVNRGLGNSVFPFRIFNRPEIVVVTLKSKNKNSV